MRPQKVFSPPLTGGGQGVGEGGRGLYLRICGTINIGASRKRKRGTPCGHASFLLSLATGLFIEHYGFRPVPESLRGGCYPHATFCTDSDEFLYLASLPQGRARVAAAGIPVYGKGIEIGLPFVVVDVVANGVCLACFCQFLTGSFVSILNSCMSLGHQDHCSYFLFEYFPLGNFPHD